MKRGLFALSLYLCASCIKQTPPVRLETPLTVAVAYVVDSSSELSVSEPPDEVKAAVEAELSKRNLVVTRIPHAQVAEAFAGQRDTARRYALLKATAAQSPLVALVELKTAFFSQLTGQYRWQVFGKISAGKTNETIDPNTDVFEKPIFHQFDHQRGREALVAAAPFIAERVGGVFDGFLRGAAAPGPSAASSGDGLGLVYFVMVDRFANGDPKNDGAIDVKDPNAFHGGDLQGVIDRLDYLQALGVKTLWLSPVFKMRTEKFYGYGAYHGYWTYDLAQVEPRFGDETLLRKLSDELHARKMKLVLDLVLNHVGPDAPLVKEKPHWFHRQGALEKWDDPVEVVNKDVHGLPDLASENEEVYRYLLSTSLGWIDRVKPDGFRLDAVKHMPNSFWARFNADVKKHAGEDFILLGELLEGDAEKLAPVWREGGFTHMFDFPLHFALVDVFCKGQPMSRLSSTLSQDSLYPDPGRLVTLVDNHDLPRIAESCSANPRGIHEALSFIGAVRGTPAITWGTEVGLKGAKEPENRADMQFNENGAGYYAIKGLAHAVNQRSADLVPFIVDADDSLLALGWLAPNGAQMTAFNGGAKDRDYRLPDPLRGVFEVGVVGYSRGEPVPVPAHSHTGAQLKAKSPETYAVFREKAKQQWLKAESRQKVSFNARAPVEQGDALFVVGSGEALGAWRLDAAKGPFVEGQLEAQLAEGFAYEFKLVIKRKDGRTEWEPGQNRALFVPFEAQAMSLKLVWGERNG